MVWQSLMLERFFDNRTPSGFLHWWNENPIILGGDRYSASPGLGVYYIQHSDESTFDLKIEPIQQDKPDFTQAFLERIVEQDSSKHLIQLKLKDDNDVLATAILHVDEHRRWALGEGNWYALKGRPRDWTLECQLV